MLLPLPSGGCTTPSSPPEQVLCEVSASGAAHAVGNEVDAAGIEVHLLQDSISCQVVSRPLGCRAAAAAAIRPPVEAAKCIYLEVGVAV